MKQSITNRLNALESQISTEDKTITAIVTRVVNPDGTYTGDILTTDLLSDKKETVKTFDKNLKGNVCVVRPKIDDEES